MLYQYQNILALNNHYIIEFLIYNLNLLFLVFLKGYLFRYTNIIIKTAKRKISSSQVSKLKAEISCLSEDKSKFQKFLMD